MTLSVWRHIMDTTNLYARTGLGSMPPSSRFLYSSWHDITLPEIKAFIGLIINMEMVQLTNIKDCLSTHFTLNLPFFRTVFPQDRLIGIYWKLHVWETPSTAKCSKIQPFLDLLLPLFRFYVTLSCKLSIDESMIDRLDQWMSYYQYTRRTISWWRKVFTGWLMSWLSTPIHNTQTLAESSPTKCRRELVENFANHFVTCRHTDTSPLWQHSGTSQGLTFSWQ